MFEEEFLRGIYNYFEYLSLIIAIIFYNRYKGFQFYKFFIIYLINLVLFGIIAITFFKETIFLFNIYTFFEFNFFALIYYNLIQEKKSLKILSALFLLFNLIYFLSFIYLELSKYTVSLEGLFNSIFIILYFKELLTSKKVLNYKKLLPFWISVGFLIFYITSIPFFTLLHSKYFDTRIMFPILYSLIIVFHLCFIYGLVTCKKMED